MTISEHLSEVARGLLNPLMKRIRGILRQEDGKISDKE